MRSQNPDPIRRTAEIEEITNRHLIHPAASRLVPLFARLGVTPNAVSVTGMLFGILAGIAYYHYTDPRLAVAGFILMVAWHVMDGADGQLARLTRSQSRFGQVLDGLSDNVAFLAVYTGLAVALSRTYGGAAYALAAAAAMCHAIQAATYEAQRQEYDCWGWARNAAQSPQSGNPSPAHTAAPDVRAARSRRLRDSLHWLFYTGLSFPAAGITRKTRTAMTTALERHPEGAAHIRQRYREVFAPRVRLWSALSANYRTLGIFIAAWLKAPEYYFWFDIFGFSAILGLLLRAQNTGSDELIDSLE